MRLVKEWFNRRNEPQPEYRCVIVGAGSGGCVTAYTQNIRFVFGR